MPAGHQAQVDFARFVTSFTDEPGPARIIWLFSFVLCHSRYIFARFVMHQDLQTLLPCHMQAFEAIGGIPIESSRSAAIITVYPTARCASSRSINYRISCVFWMKGVSWPSTRSWKGGGSTGSTRHTGKARWRDHRAAPVLVGRIAPRRGVSRTALRQHHHGWMTLSPRPVGRNLLLHCISATSPVVCTGDTQIHGLS